jgi:hypothetical protein
LKKKKKKKKDAAKPGAKWSQMQAARRLRTVVLKQEASPEARSLAMLSQATSLPHRCLVLLQIWQTTLPLLNAEASSMALQ